METVATTAVNTTSTTDNLTSKKRSSKRSRSCRSPDGADRKRMKVADTERKVLSSPCEQVEFTVSPEKAKTEEEISLDASFSAAIAASQEAPFEPPAAHNTVQDGPMEPVPDNLTEEMPCVEKKAAGTEPLEAASDAPTEEMLCVEKTEATDQNASVLLDTTVETDFVPPAPETKQPACTSEPEKDSTDAPTEEMPSCNPSPEETQGDQDADGDEDTEDENKTVQQVQSEPVEPQTPLMEKPVNTVPVFGQSLHLIDENSRTVLETPQQPQGKENVLTESRFESSQDSQPLILKPLQFDSQASRDGCFDESKDLGDNSQVELTSQEHPSTSRFGCSIM